MKAMVVSKFGPPDGLQLREVDKPLPKANEVLINIRATTVTTADCELRSLNVPIALRLPIRIYLGLGKSKRIILGQELAGVIEAAGKDVTRFRSGDPVVAWTGLRLGAYAEYTCLPEDGVLATKASNMTFEVDATLAVCGLEAAHFLSNGVIQS